MYKGFYLKKIAIRYHKFDYKIIIVCFLTIKYYKIHMVIVHLFVENFESIQGESF